MAILANSNKKLTIAIDGFSSCGKSTFAKKIAAQLGYVFIDTGAMYRAVTLYAIDKGFFGGGELDTEKLIGELDNIDITFQYNESRGAADIFVNGEAVEGQIRTIEVSNRVSTVSSVAQVREKLVAMQQAMGRSGGVVLDGRDIGTVVFPDAEIKLFMTADPMVRAERRFKELQAKGDGASLDEVYRNVVERDHADQNRAISPLRQADDAIVLDNSNMTVDEQMEFFMNIYNQKVCR